MFKKREAKAAVKKLENSINNARLERDERDAEKSGKPGPSKSKKAVQKANNAKQKIANVANAFSSMSPAQLAGVAAALATVSTVGVGIDNQRNNNSQQALQIEQKAEQSDIPLGLQGLDFSGVEQADLLALAVLPELQKDYDATTKVLSDLGVSVNTLQTEQDNLSEVLNTVENLGNDITHLQTVATSIPGLTERIANSETLLNTLELSKADAIITRDALNKNTLDLTEALTNLELANTTVGESLSDLQVNVETLRTVSEDLVKAQDEAKVARDILQTANITNSSVLLGQETDLAVLQAEVDATEVAVKAAQNIADDAARSAAIAQSVADQAVLDAAAAQAEAELANQSGRLALSAAASNSMALGQVQIEAKALENVVIGQTISAWGNGSIILQTESKIGTDSDCTGQEFATLQTGSLGTGYTYVWAIGTNQPVVCTNLTVVAPTLPTKCIFAQDPVVRWDWGESSISSAGSAFLGVTGVFTYANTVSLNFNSLIPGEIFDENPAVSTVQAAPRELLLWTSVVTQQLKIIVLGIDPFYGGFSAQINSVDVTAQGKVECE